MHEYFSHGFEKLNEHAQNLNDTGKLVTEWESFKKEFSLQEINKTNKAQKKLAEKIVPFFEKYHELLKTVDKEVRHIEKEAKDSEEWKKDDSNFLKRELEALNKEARALEKVIGKNIGLIAGEG